jgi:assimilatory nitrate reductase catalytic subunit
MFAVATRPATHRPDAEYSLILNTGRVRDQWHTMTRTGMSPRLSQHMPEPYLEIHPADAARCAVRDGELARVESRWGAAVARVCVTDALRLGELFMPMHWNDQFGRAGLVNVTVNPAVDPVSGQPELKHTPVRVVPIQAAWFGFALTRERVALAQDCYWTAAIGHGHWRYEIAGETDAAAIVDRFAPNGPAECLKFSDTRAGALRKAWLVGGRLAACVFIAPKPRLPARQWLAGLFAAEALAPADRRALLAGRAATGLVETGPTICACFGVGRDTILAAASSGATSCEKIGAAVKAGTNCGSCLPEIQKLLADTRPSAA